MLGFHQVHGDRAAQAMIQGNTRPQVIGPVWQIPRWWVLLPGLFRTWGAAHPGRSAPPAQRGPARLRLCAAPSGRTAYLTGLAALLAALALVHRGSWLRPAGWPLLSRWGRLWV